LGILYSDVPAADAQMFMSSTVKQSLDSFRKPCGHGTNEIKVPITYVASTQDMTIPYVAQKAFTQAAKAEAVLVDCGHSPFAKVEKAAVVVDAIQKAVDL
jgi:alpha-beta hydrolase superfamily lysophospholipase